VRPVWPAVALAGVLAFDAGAEGPHRPPVGACTLDLASARAAGFDYAEIRLREIEALSDEAFAAFARAHGAVGLPTPAANVLLPPDLKVVGPGVDEGRLSAYLRRALGRARTLGVEVVVFGSGGARRVPEGFPRAEAWRQLVAAGRRAALEAAGHGIVVAAEPLRRAETNLVNTTTEGLEWVKAVDHPSFQLMVDLFHMTEEGEDPAVVVEAGSRLRHVHVATPGGRGFPPGAGTFDYAPFFRALRRAGYGGRISIEAARGDLAADGPPAIGFIRSAWAAAEPAR
jgi:sugar phosphate isomerase/epimerase